ncbi:hypothetical protein MC885_019652, partial [Smutsia gigantea]
MGVRPSWLAGGQSRIHAGLCWGLSCLGGRGRRCLPCKGQVVQLGVGHLLGGVSNAPGEVAPPLPSLDLEWLTWAYVSPAVSSSCVLCCRDSGQ